MTTTPDPASIAEPSDTSTAMTGDEMFDSITGFEEIAIAKTFKRTLGDIAQNDPLQLNRALVFALLRRSGGLNETEAYRKVQELGTKAIREYFQPAEDDAANPESESGKDGSPSA